MFDWKPEYSVHIPGIDAQHKRLFALVAELHTAMSQGKGKTVLQSALTSLVDYTKAHFAAEEQLMRKYGYPEFAVHKAQHDELTSQVLDFQQKFLRHETVMTVDLMIFLKTWLQNHIIGSDQKYSAYIRSKTAA